MAVLTLFLVLVMGAARSVASDVSLRLQMSPYTHHYRHKAAHRDVWLAGLELERAQGTIHGIAFFRNSFGQSSLYAYPWGGMHRNVLNFDRLFFKWSIGLVYGYRHPYEDKLPLNHHGYAPAIVPAVGWEFESGFSTQLVFLGTSGVMFLLAKDL